MIQCSLTASFEFVLTFLNQSIIQDQAGNSLNTKYLTVKAPHYSYIDPGMKDAVTGSGTAFSTIGTITVILGLAMVIVQ